MGLDEVEEELVDAGVAAEFRMEGGGHQVTVADEHWIIAATGEDLDLRSDSGDAGSSDEDHLQRFGAEGGRREDDGGVQLAAVGVAFDRDGECGEGGLWGIGDVIREQDGAGAGAEGGGLADEVVESFKEAVALQVAQEGGGLAAGDDETVEAGELRGTADERRIRAEAAQDLGVGRVGSLESKHADVEPLMHEAMI